MATSKADLTLRIGAELAEIKAAIASLKKDVAGIGQASRVNPFQNVVDGAKQAQTAAAGVERSVSRARDARGRFVGGRSGGGGGGGTGGQAGLFSGAGGTGRAAFAGITAGATSALASVTRLAGGIASIATALALISAADELVTLNARLRLSTNSVDDFNRAQRELFEIAQRTRSGLGETINLFSRISLATKDAKVGQDVLLEVVETINKAVQLSGSSSQAAEAALVQLGQGLASGTLRGEELNSVLEQTPALADAIAKGMGITRGELRKFGQEGKIGAQQVIEALQKQRDEVNQQFAQLPLTVGQAVTQVKNASLQLLGAFNESAGATAGLAESIGNLAEFLSSDEVLGSAVEFSSIWTQAFESLGTDFREAVRIVEEASTDILQALGIEGGGVLSLLARAFKEFPINVRASIQAVTTLIAGGVDIWISAFRLAKEAFAAIFTDDTIDAAIARNKARVDNIVQAVRDRLDDISNERERALAEAKQIAQGTLAARRAATDRNDAARRGRGRFTTQLSDEQRRAIEAQRKAEADREEKLAKDSTDRIARVLDDYYADTLIGLQQYYDAKRTIELNAVQQNIDIQRRLLDQTASKAERTKILTEIELLERQKTDIQVRSARDRKKAVEAVDRELDAARAQDLENRGEIGAAAKIRLEAEFRDLLKRLEAAGNTEGVKLVQRLIDTGVARARFQELEDEFDRVMQRLQARQQQINDQLQSGALAPSTANQAQSEARQQAAAELEVLAQKMRELADATNDPRIQEGARRATEALRGIARDSATGVEAAMQELRATLAQLDQDFGKLAVSNGVDALTQFFTDVADGSKDADDALRDFVRGFVRSMAEIAARALATFLVLQLLDAIYPGLGQIVAGGANVGARVRHSGGAAGQGTLRRVNPLVFIGAPRFHQGTSGELGIKPGEVPAILKDGETVLNEDESAVWNSGGRKGGAGDAGTRIVNLWNPNDLVDAMSSAAGERVILNVIERNAGAVRQKLS